MSIAFVSPKASASVTLGTRQTITVKFVAEDGGKSSGRTLNWSTDDLQGNVFDEDETTTDANGQSQNVLHVASRPVGSLRVSVWEEGGTPAGHYVSMYDVVDAALSINFDRIDAVPSPTRNTPPANGSIYTIRATVRATDLTTGSPAKFMPIQVQGLPNIPTGLYTESGDRVIPDDDGNYVVTADETGMAVLQCLNASESAVILIFSAPGAAGIQQSVLYSQLAPGGVTKGTLAPLIFIMPNNYIDLNGPLAYVTATFDGSVNLKNYTNCTVFVGNAVYGPVLLSNLPTPGEIQIPKSLFVSGQRNKISYCMSRSTSGNAYDSQIVEQMVQGVPPQVMPPNVARTLVAPSISGSVVNNSLIAGGLNVKVKPYANMQEGDQVDVTVYVNDDGTRQSFKLDSTHGVLFGELRTGFNVTFEQFAMTGYVGQFQAEYAVRQAGGGTSVAYSKLLTVPMDTSLG